MRKNTRFNPTVNGLLHVGHIYMALVNYHEAKRRNGKFILRFDDSQAYWNLKEKVNVHDIRTKMKEDFESLGIIPDKCVSELEVPWEENLEILLSYKNLPDKIFPKKQPFESTQYVDFVPGDSVPYPYNPYFTIKKVIMDWDERVNLLIRGEDLYDEYSLYSYFCDLLTIPNPWHVYLPRLTLERGWEVDEVSKTRGNLTYRNLLSAGYSAQDVLDKLAESCLIAPEGGWFISNVKQKPVWKFDND